MDWLDIAAKLSQVIAGFVGVPCVITLLALLRSYYVKQNDLAKEEVTILKERLALETNRLSFTESHIIRTTIDDISLLMRQKREELDAMTDRILEKGEMSGELTVEFKRSYDEIFGKYLKLLDKARNGFSSGV